MKFPTQISPLLNFYLNFLWHQNATYKKTFFFFSRFADLTEQDALDLACGVEEIQNGVLREDFATSFVKVENFEATLDFSVREYFDDETKKKRKEEKQKEKQRKKEEREKRIAMYNNSKKKKSEL